MFTSYLEEEPNTRESVLTAHYQSFVESILNAANLYVSEKKCSIYHFADKELN